jgi:hypothetical protein
MVIRNSTVEFLIFSAESAQDGIEVRFQNETIWLSQKMIAVLFDCSIDNISLHLKNIFNDSDIITGFNVNKKAVLDMSDKGSLEQYKIIHFATHGIVVPKYPELSFVDALTVACMKDPGITEIYSFYSDFDGIAGITRLDQPSF